MDGMVGEMRAMVDVVRFTDQGERVAIRDLSGCDVATVRLTGFETVDEQDLQMETELDDVVVTGLTDAGRFVRYPLSKLVELRAAGDYYLSVVA